MIKEETRMLKKLIFTVIFAMISISFSNQCFANPNEELRFIINTDDYRINAMTAIGDDLFTLSYNGLIRIWDVTKNKIKLKKEIILDQGEFDGISGCQGSAGSSSNSTSNYSPILYGISIIENKLIISGNGVETSLTGIGPSYNEIAIFDIKTGKLINKIKAPVIKMNKNILVKKVFSETVKVWDLKSGKLLKNIDIEKDFIPELYGDSRDLHASSIDIKGDKIIVALNNRTINIYDSNTGKFLNKDKGDSFFTSNGKGLIVENSESNQIALRDIDSGKIINKLEKPESLQDIKNYFVSGQNIFSIPSEDPMSVYEWNLQTGKLSNFIDVFGSILKYTALAVANNKLIVGSDTGYMEIRDLHNEKVLNMIEGHKEDVRSIIVNDGKIISGSDDKTIKIWDINTGNLIKTLPDKSCSISIFSSPERTVTQTVHPSNILLDKVTSLAANNGKLVSGSHDTTVNIWDLNSGEVLWTLAGHNSPVHSVAIDDKKAISVGYDEKMEIWDWQTSKLIDTINNYPQNITSAEIIQDKLVLKNDKEKTKIWDLKNRKWVNSKNEPLALLTNENNLISHSEDFNNFCMDKDKICSASLHGLKIWNAKTGRLLKTYSYNKNSFVSKFLPADDKIISYTNVDNSDKFQYSFIQIFDIKSGKLLKTLNEKKGNTINSLEINKNRILTSLDNGSQTLWGIETGKKINSFSRKNNECGSEVSKYIAYKDKRIIGYGNGIIEILDLNKGKVTESIKAHEESIESLDIYNDKLLSCAVITKLNGQGVSENTKTIKIWDLNNYKLITTIENANNYKIIDDKLFVFMDDEEKNIKIVDLNTGQILNSIECNYCVSDQNKIIFTSPEDDMITLLDLNTNKILSQIKIPETQINALALWENNIISATENNIISIWDWKTGSIIKTIKDDESKINISELKIYKNKLIYLLTGNYAYNKAVIYDLNTEKEILIQKAGSVSIEGNKLIIENPLGQTEKTVKILNIETDKMSVFKGETDETNNVLYIKDNNDKYWDIEKEKYINSEDVYDYRTFTKDRIIESSGDGGVDISDLKGKSLATFYVFPDGYLIMTPQGYFIGEGNYNDYAHYVRNGDIIELRQIAKVFYRPDIVRKALAGESIARYQTVEMYLKK